MKMTSCIIVALVLVAGCADSESQLTDEERSLVHELGFDEALVSNFRQYGESLERLKGISPNFKSISAAGIIVVTKPNEGRETLEKIRSKLRETGYTAYLNDVTFGYDSDKVAILRSKDPNDYLAVMRPDGINYDLEHEAVLAQYRDWDDRYGLVLVGAGHDWIEAEIDNPPADWSAFANEVFEFCPDLVWQGTGDVETLAEEMRTQRTLYLWWD